MPDEGVTPKLFVSYSWTTPAHEAWVEALAVELEEAGVEVILDKWDLHPGHDADRFMEQMVTDPTVTKVIMVCDRAYAEKADGRRGGAGTEAQIISPELYRSTGDQDKFVAVIREDDEDGQPCRPVFARGRIHIDFTDDLDRARSFDELIRWVYGKPLHVRPPRGKRPAYLDDGGAKVRLGTSAEARRAIDALRNGRPNALAAASEYFRLFATELERLRLPPETEDHPTAIVELIDQTVPFRDEALEVAFNLLRHSDGAESHEILGSWFEALVRYDDWPEHVQGWNDVDADHYRFLIHELFLHLTAFGLAERRFVFCKSLLTIQIVHKNRRHAKSELVGFEHFRYGLQSLDYVNSKAKTRFYSLHAKMLVDRASHSTMKVSQLAQADFVLFLRSVLHPTSRYPWFPLTVFGDFRSSVDMELFTRAKSRKVLASVLDLLGLSSKQELRDGLAKVSHERLPTLGHNRIYPLEMIGIDHLGEIP